MQIIFYFILKYASIQFSCIVETQTGKFYCHQIIMNYMNHLMTDLITFKHVEFDKKVKIGCVTVYCWSFTVVKLLYQVPPQKHCLSKYQHNDHIKIQLRSRPNYSSTALHSSKTRAVYS